MSKNCFNLLCHTSKHLRVKIMCACKCLRCGITQPIGNFRRKCQISYYLPKRKVTAIARVP